MKSKLSSLRKDIDRINIDLLNLLNKRIKTAMKIGVIKARNGLPVSDMAREREIIHSLVLRNEGPIDTKGLKAIFKSVIRETKRIERITHREQDFTAGQKS